MRFVFKRVLESGEVGFRFGCWDNELTGLLRSELSGKAELELDGLEALQHGRRSVELGLFGFLGV